MAKKKIGDFTLREAYEICNKLHACQGCPLLSMEDKDGLGRNCLANVFAANVDVQRGEYEREVEVEG